MTSEGLGGMFKGDSADMGAGNFPLVWMGGPRRGSRVRLPGSEDLQTYFFTFFVFLPPLLKSQKGLS
jgi:hypothetical protein